MKAIKIIFFLVLPFLISCSNEGNKECSLINKVIGVDDKMPVIEIDFNQPKEKILYEIEAAFNRNICWEKIQFGLKLENRTVKVNLVKECLDGAIIHRKRPEVIVLLNALEKILINGDVIEMVEIKDWLLKHFSEKKSKIESLNQKEISFKWEERTPAQSVEKVIHEIIDGYILIFEKITKNRFDKQICDLSSSEVNELKTIFPFRLRLNLREVLKIPPPPVENK